MGREGVILMQPDLFLHLDRQTIYNMMPRGLAARLVGLASSHGVRVQAPPGGPGALDDRPLNYRVVDGEGVHQHAPEAIEFFTSGRVLMAVSQWAGCILRPCRHLPALVNVNLLEGTGADYQWHTDGNPVTMVFMLSTLPPEQGGALEVKWGMHGPAVAVQPCYGMATLFAAGDMPHRVAPIKGGLRISVPVAYEVAGLPDRRQAGDDAYLYGRGE